MSIVLATRVTLGNLDGHRTGVEGDQPPVRGVAVRSLVYPSQQVDRDPDGSDLVVGVRVTEPFEDPLDHRRVGPFLAGTQALPETAQMVVLLPSGGRGVPVR